MKKLLLFLILISSSVHAQLSGIILQDEGTTLGRTSILNMTGSGISCTIVGSTVACSITGTSIGNWTFSGNNATTSGSPTTLRTNWQITDSAITSSVATATLNLTDGKLSVSGLRSTLEVDNVVGAHNSELKIGASGHLLGLYSVTPVAQQTVAALTNNVTSGGTANTINDITAASVDATAAKLTDTRDAMFRMAQKVSELEVALNALGAIKH